MTALLVIVAFALGWAWRQHAMFWGVVRTRGVMEQWVEDECGHLLGRESCEEMDAIMNDALRITLNDLRPKRPRWLWKRRRKLVRRAAVPQPEHPTESTPI